MSRKYCRSCGVAHDNGGMGMCDNCLDHEERDRQNIYDEQDAEFRMFLAVNTTTEDRIRALWNIAKGYGE